MNFKVKNIIVEKKIVAKVFKYTKKKLKGVHFFTPNNLNFQIGSMSHSKNHIIKPHFHINRSKIIKQMSELLIIFSGQLKVFFYKKSYDLYKKSQFLAANQATETGIRFFYKKSDNQFY